MCLFLRERLSYRLSILFEEQKFLIDYKLRTNTSKLLNQDIRRKCESFEQKADGIFLARLKKSCIEIGYLEMSGGISMATARSRDLRSAL